ncbi:MAG: hypothetical protein IJ415_00175 [Clostridia bacterium]|nr:hypothetical protein [Clostridia bacterium]
MGLFDFMRRKKVEKNTETKPEEELPKVVINDEKVNAILDEEIKDFFPNKGVWYSNCFRQSSEVSYSNLPCHLRDNDWLSKLLHRKLNDKGIYIPKHTIKKFMDSSETFANLRHKHELRIVKWQINWINNGGSNWLAPEGTDEFSLLFSEDVDKIIRGGVVKTLRAIGMDGEVIEEGLEKYADIWRPSAMSKGFGHKYEPIVFMVGTPGKADEDHKQNWIADREYRYYQEHKNSVDNYGIKTPAMQMTAEEHAKLATILEKQNEQRSRFIEHWRQNSKRKPIEDPDYVEIEHETYVKDEGRFF